MKIKVSEGIQLEVDDERLETWEKEGETYRLRLENGDVYTISPSRDILMQKER